MLREGVQPGREAFAGGSMLHSTMGRGGHVGDWGEVKNQGEAARSDFHQAILELKNQTSKLIKETYIKVSTQRNASRNRETTSERKIACFMI